MGVDIENDGAEREKDSRGEHQIFVRQTLVDELAEVNAHEMQADEQTCQKAKTPENHFFRNDSSREEGLGSHKPEDGHIVPGIMEWNGGKHQRRANYA